MPEAVAARLQSLLDRQDAGQHLPPEERAEAEGLRTRRDLASGRSALGTRPELLKSKGLMPNAYPPLTTPYLHLWLAALVGSGTTKGYPRS